MYFRDDYIKDTLKEYNIYVCDSCNTIFKKGFKIEGKEDQYACSERCKEYLLSYTVQEINNTDHMGEFLAINEKLHLNINDVYYNDECTLSHNRDYQCNTIPSVYIPAFDIYSKRLMNDIEKEEIINNIEFEVIKLYPNGKDQAVIETEYGEEYVEKVKGKDIAYALYDLQGGNLGNIESELFLSYDEMLDRLDHYFEDYDILIID